MATGSKKKSIASVVQEVAKIKAENLVLMNQVAVSQALMINVPKLRKTKRVKS